MQSRTPWRMRVLGWGNLVIGVATPIVITFNILGALKVFSVEWAKGSIVIATILGAFMGYLTGRSGWGLLHSRPWAYGTTCIAGGLTLGYTVMGIFIMTTSGIDRGLEILFRHGSEDWWDWTLSHFQNSALREIPILTWWVLGLGTLVRYKLPGGPESAWDRFFGGISLVLLLGIVGAVARMIQLAQDTLLSSQR